MAAVAGLRGTGDWGTDERPKNFRESILKRKPNGSAPLVALSAKMKKQTTDDPEYSWWEEEYGVFRFQANGGETAGAASITVDEAGGGMVATHLKAGDLLLVESGVDATYSAEILQVLTTPTVATEIPVTRGVAGTSAAVIADNAWLLLIGSAYEEGTSAPDAVSRNPTKYFNYTQIFKDTYEITGTAEQTRTRTGDPVANDKARKMYDHSTKLEQAWIFGRRSEVAGAAKGKPKRTSDGIIAMLANASTQQTNATHCYKIWSSAATLDSWIDATEPMFDHVADGVSTSDRIVLGGRGYLTKLAKLIRADGASTMEMGNTITQWGMRLKQIEGPSGTYFFRTHPLFNVNAGFQNSAIFLNANSFVMRPLKGRDTKMRDNVQADDEDSRRGYWMTEAGPEIHFMKTMAFHHNFNI